MLGRDKDTKMAGIEENRILDIALCFSRRILILCDKRIHAKNEKTMSSLKDDFFTCSVY